MIRTSTSRTLAVGALAALMLSGCSGGEPEAAPTPAATTSASPARAPSEQNAAPETIEIVRNVGVRPVLLSRDPFRPVLPVIAPENPDAPTNPNPQATPDGCTSTASGEVCDGQLVELVGVSEAAGVRNASVRVDGALYTVESGDVFAVSYLVQSIDGRCVSLLYGDELFTLCEGDSVLK